ncbi:MAG: MarR family transcriptional regulator [Thermoplasmata archaeon]|nr:MarR family transcriptional regulator [Thermoplasmata archaeon]
MSNPGVNSKLSETDLTLTQFKVLYVLSHCTDDGTATQKQIEEHLYITHPTAVGLFRRMESKGLIENLGREDALVIHPIEAPTVADPDTSSDMTINPLGPIPDPTFR